MKEQWRPVVGYEKFYEISSLGRLRGLARVDCRGQPRPKKIRKTFFSPHGYERVALCKDRKLTRVLVHRIVGEAFIPNNKNLPQINHINGIKGDNRACNLEWASRSHNTKHAYSLGLICRKGENNSQSKIREGDILEIRRLSAQGAMGRDLSRIFKISPSVVSAIINRKTWKHV